MVGVVAAVAVVGVVLVISEVAAAAVVGVVLGLVKHGPD